MNIRDRIKELRRVPANELRPNPKNWRTHPEKQLNAIRGVLAEVGFAGAELARELEDGTLELIDGHARAEVAGTAEVPVLVLDVNEAEANKILATFDPIGAMAESDAAKLDSVLREVETANEDLSQMIADLANDAGLYLDDVSPEIHEDEIPETPFDPVTKLGDVWILGKHRLVCGDSTNVDNVARLMDGKSANLLHADPPYGMGKEKDGIANDNLYGEKLDAFQMKWWKAFRKHINDNGSAYIWGNAADLWRLWYSGGLSDSERLTIRNEIVWDKKTAGAGGISHMGADGFRQYPNATERCLFFMIGEQGFNNNSDNYWDGWDSIRLYLEKEMRKIGWSVGDINKITNTKMGGHWVTKSQWSLITAGHYKKLQQAAINYDAFKREHDDLNREHDDLKRKFYATRAYFDNAHDNMTDVWEFPRVTGDERHGHATPKPVSMMVRAIKSSCPENGIVVEPFFGSGTTLIAAEQLGRTCYGMELSPAYCDVIIERWQNLTGEKAKRGK